MMNAVDAPAHQTKTRSKEKTDRPWQVIVLDDPVNLMEYVSRVLIRILDFRRRRQRI